MSFYGGQTFFLSPGQVQNASEIGISGIDLFFSQKPNANNNASGVTLPGVSVSIVPCVNGLPDVTRMLGAPISRVNYVDVRVDPTSQVSTRFEFLPPVQVTTNTYYAAVIQVDDPNFKLWGETIGQPLLGTTILCTGPSGPYVGAFYDFATQVPVQTGNITTNSSMTSTGNSSSNSVFANTATITGTWSPRTNFDLKFTVFAARYSVGGNTQLNGFVSNAFPANAQITITANVTYNSNGETVYTMPALRYDYVAYASGNSSNVGVLVGEKVFQNTVFYPGGTATPAQVSVTAGSNRITVVNTAQVNWSTALSVGTIDPEYIVVTSGNAFGPGASQVNLRQVVGLISNSVAVVDEPFTFSNAISYFFRTPVGTVDQWMHGRLFGVNQDIMVLANVTSNDIMRFVNDSIVSVGINVIGASYTNTDYFEVTGFESVANKVIGGYKANGNINTFANGSLANVYLANLGCGFVNASTIVVTFYAANGAASNGASATLTTNVGSTMCGENLGLTGTGGYFVQCKIINIEVGNEVVGLGINNPGSTVYHATNYLPYYSVDDSSTFLGRVYYVDANTAADVVPASFGQVVYPFQFTKRRAMMSWSNENITPYVNGAQSFGTGGFPGSNLQLQPMTSNGSILQVNAVSNSDFGAVALAPGWSTITFSRYIVNNDYTLENTNYGNAWAKGIEVNFNTANGKLAEDLVVYSTCYRPEVANVIMYARLYNSSDPDQFTDKDWTMLQLNGGSNVFSSMTSPGDILELTWGLRLYPNNTILVGSATVTDGQSNIIGVGTAFQTNTSVNLVSGDLVIVYQPLFANTDYRVAVVNSVVSDTRFSIIGTFASPADTDIIGDGMHVAKILFPHQGFKNPQNANVARYYNSQGVPFDGFDVCQMKAVMISSNGFVVPMLTDIRTVAVSA